MDSPSTDTNVQVTTPGDSLAGSEYEYASLEDDHIRILMLEESSNPEEPLRCSLQHILLKVNEPRLKYICLSYVWGKTYPDGLHLTSSVICDGAEIRITSSLHEALTCIRQFPNPKDIEDLNRRHQWRPSSQLYLGQGGQIPIWADAICINQADISERSQQVMKMRLIYSLSSQLIIWLGPWPSDLLSLSTELMVHHDKYSIIGPDFPHAEDLDFEAMQREHDVRSAILSSPWFRRRWVIQEYVASGNREGQPLKNCWFLLGNQILHRDAVMGMLGMAKDRLDAGPLKPSLHKADGDILYHLFLYEDAECSDPHDLIYSLMGLSNSPSQSIESAVIRPRAWAKVDYSRPIQEFFYDFACHFTKEFALYSGEFTALLASASARKGSRGQTVQDFPSWIPDWRVKSSPVVGAHKASLEFVLTKTVPAWSDLDPIVLKSRQLRLTGLLLEPCFPPRDSSHCSTCSIFADCWQDLGRNPLYLLAQPDRLSAELKARLESLNPNVHTLLVIGHYSPVFVLDKTGHSPTTYTLSFCFCAEVKYGMWDSSGVERQLITID